MVTVNGKDRREGAAARPRISARARAALGSGAVLMVALVPAACGEAGQGHGSSRPTIVATTTILGDVAGRVAECGGLEVSTLIPRGADPHDYAPSSADVRDMVEADLVIANGLGLEEGLASALQSARDDGAVVLEVAPLLEPRPLGSGEHADTAEADADGGDDDGDAALDPHVWLDVSRMADAAEIIGAELAASTGDDGLVRCGEQVAAELISTDGEVRDVLASIPAGSRVLVTDHDAFGYFAQAYGFEVIGVVVPGGSTLAEPSSEELATLADVVRTAGVGAIFANSAHRTVLIEALSAEVGDVDVVELYVGSLGAEGSGAEDYAGMMLTDAQLIARALEG
ncbi:metal ABC transporter substrate-binding protein [Actinotalea subterranea]|uniref:metal ABC transporter substrate-binding protein n=1 Tax=Actinotalea subterranea TaxID=2607497 RepID=UPI00165DB61D|nr:metal ABC transporter substrate-binding protein [Actinotalea subterranea]